jgi:MFS family permease
MSLILTHRMIQDPPHLVREQQLARRDGMRIDFIGLALLALTFGPLQVVLDKGEEDDWFQSHFIVAFAAIAATAFVIGIIWELYQEHPIVNLRLYKNRNFAVASMLMFAFGFLLYGTTVLLPEFVQLLMGYTAELAGTILSPGALLIITLMPLVGALIARTDARWILGFGFLLLSLSLFHMTGIDLQLSWWNAMMLRTYQSLAIAFLFVPINTVTDTGVKLEQNNQVSGLINLMRNIGASTGISLTGAMVTERGQFHQAQLAQSATSYSSHMHAAIQNLAGQLGPAGLSMPDATHQASGRIYAALVGQAQTLAYIDTFWVFAACSKEEGPPPRNATTSAGAAGALTPVSSPTPAAISLTREEVEKVRALVGPSLMASQREVFGKEVVGKTTFDVDAKGPVAVVQLKSISNLLLNWNGTLTTTDGGRVPYVMTAIVQFGAFEIANLSSRVLSDLADADALELQIVTVVPDKYGNSGEWKFFSSVITRDQAAKMNWDWFRSVVLQGDFDPTALKEFAIYFGEPPTAQDMGLVLKALRESWEQGAEAYGGRGGRRTALTLSVQMANWYNCALQ